MPSVTVHMHLADRVLNQWSRRPSGAPFSAESPRERIAFLLGAMGPDMGYLPGGHLPISDLAHTLRPACLTRALLAHAATPVQRAFSWGWVTHVLADILIHPLVGCAVGELVYRTPAVFVDGDRDPVHHTRVEVGLDALYAQRFPELLRVRFRAVLKPRDMSFLVRAFQDVYGAAPEADQFLLSHRNAVRRLGLGLQLTRLVAKGLPPHPGADTTPGRVSLLGRVRSFVGRRSVSLAFLLPAPPPLWLINAVRDVEENFVELFLEEYELGGLGLRDVNLDTGRPDLVEVEYSGLGRALSFLEERGVNVPTPRRALEAVS